MNQKAPHDSKKGSFHTYLSGYLLSMALTLVAFSLVKRHVDSGHVFPSDNYVLVILAGLAITQLLVQLVFFLHLDRESKPRWNLTVLALAAIVVFILVAGSIWIISNLDYHHGGSGQAHHGHSLAPTQTDQQIINDEGISR